MGRSDDVTEQVPDGGWDTFAERGYLHLGRVLSDADLATLQQRIDAIMLGEADVDYDRMLMQLDSTTGRTGDAGRQSRGFKGPTLAYRKIQDLELDPVFRAYMTRPLFRDICAHVYGDIPISSYRAMFMNKPAHRGTQLPWHQDRWSALDRDPLITVWTALDPATVANGCVQIIAGSHRHGVINPANPSGFLTEEQTERHCPPDRVEDLELAPGEAVLLHNWLLHSSQVNGTDIPRRAFSVCYLDARTVDSHRDRPFPALFGADLPAA